MSSSEVEDYYELLQVSDVAEPETINRVYRMLAQRYHPDNQETGNEARFRAITEAYQTLSNPEKRAQYDATNQKRKKDRWRLVSAGAQTENDFEMERSSVSPCWKLCIRSAASTRKTPASTSSSWSA